MMFDVESLKLLFGTHTFSPFVMDDLNQWVHLWETALMSPYTFQTSTNDGAKENSKQENKTGFENLNTAVGYENTEPRGKKTHALKTMHLFDGTGQIQHGIKELNSILVKRKSTIMDHEHEIIIPGYNLFSDIIVKHTAESPSIPVIMYSSNLLYKLYHR